MWKVQATGDRIRAVLRHDSEPYRGQGRDRMCVWGMKTNCNVLVWGTCACACCTSSQREALGFIKGKRNLKNGGKPKQNKDAKWNFESVNQVNTSFNFSFCFGSGFQLQRILSKQTEDFSPFLYKAVRS